MTFNRCTGCKYAINPQSYFHACNNPDRLRDLKRFYYTTRVPVDGCFVAPESSQQKPKHQENSNERS